MSEVKTYLATLEVVECGSCGIPFAFPQDMVQKRRQDGKDFYCPNGHRIAYTESEVKRLSRQLKAEEAKASWAERRANLAEYRRRAAKGQLTKFRRQVAKGMCPCCQEHFPDLEEHMKAFHPNYQEGEADE